MEGLPFPPQTLFLYVSQCPQIVQSKRTFIKISTPNRTCDTVITPFLSEMLSSPALLGTTLTCLLSISWVASQSILFFPFHLSHLQILVGHNTLPLELLSAIFFDDLIETFTGPTCFLFRILKFTSPVKMIFPNSGLIYPTTYLTSPLGFLNLPSQTHVPIWRSSLLHQPVPPTILPLPINEKPYLIIQTKWGKKAKPCGIILDSSLSFRTHNSRSANASPLYCSLPLPSVFTTPHLISSLPIPFCSSFNTAA